MNALLTVVKKMTFTPRLSNTSRTNQLKIWGDATTIYKVMLDVIKKTASPRALLGPLLKTSRSVHLFRDFLIDGLALFFWNFLKVEII